MPMICDSCHQECYGVSIRGIMLHDRVFGRKPARICHTCEDKFLFKAPCGAEATMMFGYITCKHGFTYKLDYRWENDIANLFYKFVKRDWWSFIFFKKHPME